MGQSHVVKALTNALTSGRVHHAFLFTGTRGIGKTTLARIFAKSLNCEQGMSANPCGICSVCKGVDRGSYIDLIEVDAASRTGIDDMRELLDNVQYAPTQGNFKVYLIDEVHMLSKSSFNALLKTLEEPPEHVKFLFATTDPQKLPVTVLSRCLQFNLKVLEADEIYQQLSHILSAEEIAFEESGLNMISRAAGGSLRDALSLLEQGIAQGDGSISEESVRSMLGTVKAQHMDLLLTAIIENNADKALEVVVEMGHYAADFLSALDQLLIELHLIALAQISPKSLQYKVTDLEKYEEFAGQISAEDVQLCYQIALLCKRDIALAPDYRSGFEMALLRIIAFKPTNEQKINQLDNDAVDIQLNEKTSSNLDKGVSDSEIVVSNNISPDRTEKHFEHQQIPLQEEPNTEQVEEDNDTSQVIQRNAFAEMRAKIDSSVDNEIPPSQSSVETFSAQESNLKDNNMPSLPTLPEDSAAVIEELDERQAPNLNTSYTGRENQNFSNDSIQNEEIEGFSRESASDGFIDVSHTNHIRNPEYSEHTETDIGTPGFKAVPNFAAKNNREEFSQFSPPILNQKVQLNDDLNERDVYSEQGLPQPPMSEWAGFVQQLNLNGLVLELAMNIACADINAEPMILYLDSNFQYMLNPSREEVIVDEIKKMRGSETKVKILIESTIYETPAERLKRLSEEKLKNTKQQLIEDPAIKSVMNTLDMSFDESSVKLK